MRKAIRRFPLCFLVLAMLASASVFASPTSRDELTGLAVTNGKPVIADFGLGFCQQCKKQSETLERVRKAYGDKVIVRMVNVGKEAGLTERYAVEWIPTLVFFDSTGNVVLKKVGPMGYDAIRDQLSRMGVK